LIRNKQASDSITIYDNEVAFSAIDQQNAEQKSRDEIFPLITKIFDASVFEEMVDNTGKIHRPIGNPKLASTSSDLLNEFAMHIHFLKTTYRLTYEEIQDALQYAERLITFLKTEYHLK
jgi:hypothetical protein